jgi:hypothetical protein
MRAQQLSQIAIQKIIPRIRRGLSEMEMAFNLELQI